MSSIPSDHPPSMPPPALPPRRKAVPRLTSLPPPEDLAATLKTPPQATPAIPLSRRATSHSSVDREAAIAELKKKPLPPLPPRAVKPTATPRRPTVKERAELDAKESLQIIEEVIRQGGESGRLSISLPGVEAPIAVTFTLNQLGKAITAYYQRKGRTFEIHYFATGAYNGPMKEDFQNRLRLLSETALRIIDREMGGRGSFKRAVSTLEIHYQQQIEVQCQIDINIIKQGGEGVEEYYNSIQQRAVQLTGQYTRDLQTLLSAGLGRKRSFKLDHLKREEIERVIERGRPTFVNLYEVEPHRLFVSMQEPAARAYEGGEEQQAAILPSIARDRPGLANYVITSFGEYTTEGVNLLFQGIRHSSFPPIHIQDQYARQAIASHNCLQMLTDETVRTYGLESLSKSSPDHPLLVRPRIMILLSPKKMDQVRNREKYVMGSWRGESETSQLEDSVAALELFRDRTIKLIIDGKEVWIRPDISYMNLGLNPEAARIGIKGKVAPSDLQEAVNRRGLIDFDAESMQFLDGRLQLLNDDAVSGLWKLYELLWRDSHVIMAQESLGRFIEIQQKELAQKREILQQLYDKYLVVLEQKEPLQGRIDDLNQSMTEIEKQIDLGYQMIYESKRMTYLINQSHILDIQAKLRARYTQLLETETDPERSAMIARVMHFHLNHLQALHLFYNGLYEKSETLKTFQTLYLIQQVTMHRHPTFFCKSAEDRTGDMNNEIEKWEIFRSLFGRYPSSPQDRAFLDTFTAPLVHQFSSSYQNTRANSESPGLQIGAQVSPAALHTQVGKRSALTWKMGWKEAVQCKPSSLVQELIRRL